MKTKILLPILFTILISVIGYAQPVGWSYSQPLTVTENSGSNVINYQLRLTINTQALIGAGQMQANGEDMRFGKNCPGTILYNYWIESGINTTTTVVWVKIDTLFASATRTFFMYYGNSTATSNSAVVGTFIGPHSATDSVVVGNAGGVANSQRGFRFSPNEDLLVTSFGKRDPQGSLRYVTLFNFATQAIVSQLQVAGPAAQYNYGNLASPIWITQGTQYLLELFQGVGDGYYFGTSSQIGQHMTYYDMKYCNSCTQNTFPTSTLANYHYGFPDLWYFTKTNVTPAPTNGVGTMLTTSAGSNATICSGSSTTIGGTTTGGSAPYSFVWTPTNDLSSSTVAMPVASPTVTTTYSVIATDANGCSATSSVTVTVNPLPTVALGSDITQCAGTVTLDAQNAGSTYLWSDASTAQTLLVTTTGTYSVVVTDLNGCTGTDVINVTINALPTVALGNDITQCGGTVTLDALNVGSTYLWSDASTAQTLVITTTGTYSVVVTDVNGCTGTDVINVTINTNPTVALGSDVTQCAGTVTLDAQNAGSSYLWSEASTTQTIVVSTTGTYIVVVTDINGCTGTDTVSVTINPLPAVDLGLNITQCGGTVTLDAQNAGSSYLWSNASTTQTIVVSSSGTYSVIVTDLNGCTGVDTVMITINAIPTVALTLNPTFVCVNWVAYALTGGTPSGGTYSGTGVSANMFNPAVSGAGTFTINYVFTDVNGCTDSAQQTITVSLCSGVEETNSLELVVLYPNPAQNELNIETSEDVIVVIVDEIGKIVLTQQVSKGKNTINTTTLANGMYQVVLQNKNGVAVKKLVVSK